MDHTHNIDYFYKLVDWVPEDKLFIDHLCTVYSVASIDICIKYFEKINWSYMSFNRHPYAIQLCKENLDKVDWTAMSFNWGAMDIIEKYPSKNVWFMFSLNYSYRAIKLCRENKNKINWKYMSKNTHPDAVQLCRENIDKVVWSNMARNTNPEAIQLCKENLDKFTKLCWKHLSFNKQIFVVDLKAIYKYMNNDIKYVLNTDITLLDELRLRRSIIN